MTWSIRRHTILGSILCLIILTPIVVVLNQEGWRCGNSPHFSIKLLRIDYYDLTDLWPQASREVLIFWMFYVSCALLMPLSWRLTKHTPSSREVMFESFSVALLAFSWFARCSAYASELPLTQLAAVPWVIVQLRHAGRTLTKWVRKGFPRLIELSLDMANVFPLIGVIWYLAYQTKMVVHFGFDPLIILLTVVHFHHAGFSLPLLAGINARIRPNIWTRLSCLAVLAGVPLVAIGIVSTHMGLWSLAEPYGVVVLVLGALGVAVSQIRRGMEKQCGWLVRAGFVISGVSLLCAMLLAMGFGLRHVVPNWALTMPQMWMIHGTLNAFGFGLCGILAWRGASR